MSDQPQPDPDDEGRPLSAEERRKIRSLIEGDERARWMWATIRIWATWVTAVAAAVIVGWDAVKSTIRAAVQ